MPELVLRGVPLSLRRDAWWLSAATDGEAPAPSGVPPVAGTGTAGGARRNPLALPLLVALTALADWLFWSRDAGLSLVLFAAACLLAVAALSPRRDARDGLRHAAIFVASALPVIETVQLLSLGFLLMGSAAVAGSLLTGRRTRAHLLPMLGARLLMALPGAAAGEASDAARGARLPRWRTLVAHWALPATVGLVFAALLTSANPVAEHWGADAAKWLADTILDTLRPVFWLAVALPLWPLLARHRLRARLDRPARQAAGRRTLRLGAFNAASVARSLVLFNLMFAVQTVLDLRYLWSGAALPEGMTYAEYAHRGAYPLVATALLAGAFALACRPFIAGRRDLRALLMLWIAQNVLLVISSLYRLDLYVDSYGLTYLRAYAAIWMALVAAGLVTVAWQIARARSNGWLITTNAVLLTATLYGAGFVNFADLIASHNLSRGGAEPDFCYLCALGPDAAAAIRRAENETGLRYCPHSRAEIGPALEGWRDWGFRSWRIRRYLAANEARDNGTDAGENPRR